MIFIDTTSPTNDTSLKSSYSENEYIKFSGITLLMFTFPFGAVDTFVAATPVSIRSSRTFLLITSQPFV